jgi:hypothetical protein
MSVGMYLARSVTLPVGFSQKSVTLFALSDFPKTDAHDCIALPAYYFDVPAFLGQASIHIFTRWLHLHVYSDQEAEGLLINLPVLGRGNPGA